MEHRQGPFSDGIGRILGILGILIASGGTIYLYQQNQALKQQIKAVEDTIGTSETAKAFNENWNEQLLAALQDFKTRANKAIERDNQAIAARNRQFQAELAKLSVDTLGTADVEGIVDRKLETLAKVVVPEALPQLRVAQSVMKPSDEGDANVAVIANDGQSAAEIKLVSFRPIQDGQFKVDEPLKMGSDSEDSWVIRFLPADNTATQTGRHHHYEQQYYLREKTIPANRSVRVAVEIENSKHIGWGLEGELVMEYGDGQTLTSRSSAVFVAGDADST